MTSTGEFYSRVTHPREIGELLALLCQPGGASMVLEEAPELPVPVVVETATPAEHLCLDLTAIQDKPQVRALRNGEAYRVFGGGQRGLVRTPVLAPTRVWEDAGRLYCQSAFPEHLEKLQRRATFRAELRASMRVRVDLHAGGNDITGWLRDLSITGCLVALEAAAAWRLEEQSAPITLEMTFPDGTHFMAPAVAHHKMVRDDHVLCGFGLELESNSAQQQMWYLVHETEREAARSAHSDRAELTPSPLYRGSAEAPATVAAPSPYQRPMARRLAHCADWLTGTILRLRQGESIDSSALSQQSEYLLTLHRQDREQLLLALACLHHEPTLVRHCLAVAVHLVDITAGLSLPAAMRKALAATGMVHDLGKELLPTPLRNTAHLDGDQYRQFQHHVTLIKERLNACQWLSPVAIEAVIEGANERLDGSGYPNHRSASEQNQLMRLTSVIDVADALGRDRVDRPGINVEAAQAHLQRYPEQFDARWAEKYRQHFGRCPIGALVRYPNHQLAWVLRIDADDGEPASVLAVNQAHTPDTTDGTQIEGAKLAALGQPASVLPKA